MQKRFLVLRRSVFLWLLVLCCQIEGTIAKSKILKTHPHVLLETLHSCPSASMRDWLQDTLQISKSMDAPICYVK